MDLIKRKINKDNSILVSKKSKSKYKKGIWVLLLMTIPFFLLEVVFKYVPLLGWSLAFFDYFPGSNLLEQDFVGLKHFIRMINDAQFIRAVRNTLVLGLIGLLLTPAPMLLAISINEVRVKFLKKTIQITTSFPNFVSWIIVYVLFFSLFSVEDGLINRILLQWNIIKEPTNILANGDVAWFFQAGVGLWKNLGWSAIIYLAAISGIDPALYEAASVDGASRLRKIWHITIPGLIPTYTVLLLLNIGMILNAGFDQYYVFMNPMTKSTLDIIDTYVYSTGIQSLNFSYATVIGMSRSVVSVILLFTANRVAKRVSGRTIL